MSIYTFYVIGYTQHIHIAHIMDRLDLSMDLTTQVVEWKSAWVIYGVQCVTMDGTAMMPPQCADS